MLQISSKQIKTLRSKSEELIMANSKKQMQLRATFKRNAAVIYTHKTILMGIQMIKKETQGSFYMVIEKNLFDGKRGKKYKRSNRLEDS